MVFGAYLRWAKRAPFMSQVAVATVKTMAADIIVQTTVEGKSLHDVNWRRVSIFGAFGCSYLGVAQYGLYVKGVQRIFDKRALEKFCNAPFLDKVRDRAGLKILGGTIALDFLLIQPLLYWPSYYCVKEIGYADNDHASNGSDHGVLSSAMAKYRNNFWQDNLGMCGFWLPMDLIIYSVPLHLRLHLNHIISFSWVALVSFFRGDAEPVLTTTKPNPNP